MNLDKRHKLSAVTKKSFDCYNESIKERQNRGRVTDSEGSRGKGAGGQQGGRGSKELRGQRLNMLFLTHLCTQEHWLPLHKQLLFMSLGPAFFTSVHI